MKKFKENKKNIDKLESLSITFIKALKEHNKKQSLNKFTEELCRESQYINQLQAFDCFSMINHILINPENSHKILLNTLFQTPAFTKKLLQYLDSGNAHEIMCTKNAIKQALKKCPEIIENLVTSITSVSSLENILKILNLKLLEQQTELEQILVKYDFSPECQLILEEALIATNPNYIGNAPTILAKTEIPVIQKIINNIHTNCDMSNSIEKIVEKITKVYNLHPVMQKIFEGASDYKIYIMDLEEGIAGHSNCLGITTPNGKVHIVASKEALAGDDKALTNFVGSIVHELVHAACYEFFHNNAYPYSASYSETTPTIKFVETLPLLIQLFGHIIVDNYNKSSYNAEGIAYFIGQYVETCLTLGIEASSFEEFASLHYSQAITTDQTYIDLFNYLDHNFIMSIDDTLNKSSVSSYESSITGAIDIYNTFDCQF
ncbi:hypothetical protein Trichorick_01353 [Candidatus Trichorickettsia mobilis]|uniref:Uncharacterized protein n=1 Tax=Candidatus Trichorickettsia mobilis TaxID=1346319 RepID=A0ABZ0UTS4_9RICK|nr:hypothetical protein [Candidatus Trichorickettsia mobilis]WPY01440.1 hypothetical protein Trichorick_01353 [Candidatus Trichorickettsia mobilis]